MVTKLNEAGIDITSDYEYALDRDECAKVFNKLIFLWPERLNVTEKLVSPDGNQYCPAVGETHFSLEDSFEDILSDPEIPGTLHEWCVVGWATCKCLEAQALKVDEIYPHKLQFIEVEKSILADHLGWKGQEPAGVSANSILTVDHKTGQILSIQNAE